MKFTLNHTGQLINYKTYAAFGETTLDTLGVTRQGYIGKEKDIENSLGDHDVRKYCDGTGSFTSVDPLFEKYLGWSPYQYSMNNPIWAKDWDGKVVVAMDKASRDNIINSVEKKYRNLVAFNDDGVAYLKENPKIAPLMKDLSNFTNIGALQYLINHKDVVEVSQDNIVFYSFNNKTEGVDLDIGQYNGIALVKSSSGEDLTSLKDVHQAIVSPNQYTQLSGPATRASTTAHEMYGHIFLFLWGQNGWNTLQYDSHKGETREHIIKAEINAKGE